MKVVNLRTEDRGDLKRAAATLLWEDNKLPSEELYIDVPAAYAEGFFANPDAFLVAAAIPAMYFGEQRVFVEGAVCPTLKYGMQSAFQWLHHWYGIGNPQIRIEADVQHSVEPVSHHRTASFFTGGVDSWSNLILNHLSYPPDHPGFIQDCFLVYGVQRVKRHNFERAVKEFKQLEAAAQVRFIPVYTNIYSHIIDRDTRYKFWQEAYNGPALIAIAHAFANRYSAVSIASGNDIPNLVPLGTHPLLDPYLSSHRLRITHDGITHSRLDKTRLITDCDVALQNLRVCDMPDIPSDRQNCGQCEKCVRTTVTLEALGALNRTQAFPYQKLSRQTLAQKCYIKHSGIAVIYGQLIPQLEAQGRHDLAEILQAKIRRYRMETLDQKYLKGLLFESLRQAKALLKRERAPQPIVESVQDVT
ncbi:MULTISPECIES: hypothetical protein [unclassified Leptolyngbya]|uniref:hypothetical protein n=1 Tax=unclassified Leptolyngbya TaxID=2650499 RepID=UPI001686CAE5|nr:MULTISPECIES: hypothetical protein [unclassified Leptolyngbya]MBD1913761.1 hypothetical protein [Leptolyngbya sp. FACHB-8]MBD2153203.1 hypothetical protein [Leptolyngbya sp. FACHB-16]